MDEGEEIRGMAEARPKGWLAERLRPLGLSLHELSVMTNEHYRQATRWNSGRYDPPPQVMEWIAKLEAFFAANPPPKRQEYVAARAAPAANLPPPFVQRIIDAMKPGETASVDDLVGRLGSSKKSVVNRLSAAGVGGRLGPLRRVGGDVYRAIQNEVPPGGSLEFPPAVDKGVTAFVGQILDVMKPGETLAVAEVASRMGVRADIVVKQLGRAAEADRMGPIRRVGEDAIERVAEEADEDDADGAEAVEAAPAAPAAAPAPTPAAAKPPRPMTTDEGRGLLDLLGWTQRGFADLLQWPDMREARRWFENHERYPMPPRVAAWLRGAGQAKRMAEKSVPRDTPDHVVAAVVGAAIAGALGDPTKVRDAALEERRKRGLREDPRDVPARKGAPVLTLAKRPGQPHR